MSHAVRARLLAAASRHLQNQPDKGKHAVKKVVHVSGFDDWHFIGLGVPNHELVADIGQLYGILLKPITEGLFLSDSIQQRPSAGPLVFTWFQRLQPLPRIPEFLQ